MEFAYLGYDLGYTSYIAGKADSPFSVSFLDEAFPQDVLPRTGPWSQAPQLTFFVLTHLLSFSETAEIRIL